MTDRVAESPAITRIAAAVEYDGSAFSGWQKQAAPEVPTVQSELEAALTRIADAPISLTCAGRTDAGVHATCQVVHFDTGVDRGIKAWTRGVNSLLSDRVRVLWAQPVDPEFHARFSARFRRYHYVLYRRQTASAILGGRVTHWRQELDIEAMNRASALLVGEQDFSSFRAAGCQSRSPNRNIMQARWFETGPFLVFDVQANAFLQHMVRNMVGALLEVGQGLKPPQWIGELLAAADRTQAGIAAPPDGLYLTAVGYDARWQLPGTCFAPVFLATCDALADAPEGLKESPER